MDSRNRLSTVILSFLIGILFYLAYEVLKPFLFPILWAIILGIAFHPLHKFILQHVRGSIKASLITLVLILLIILGPVSYLSYRLVSEIIGLSHQAGSEIHGSGGIYHYVSNLAGRFLSELGLPESVLSGQQLQGFISKAANAVLREFKEKAAQAFGISFDFLVMAITLFFVLRDGATVVRRTVVAFPLPPERKERIRSLIVDVISSSFYGTSVSMGLHGALGLVLFLIFGVPAPILMAAGAGLLSIIPVIGSLAVWAGAIAYLVFQHKITAAIIVLIVALVGTQSIDHWLRPLLVGSHGHMNFLVIFIGILGGLEFFGMIGLFLGPLVLILLQSLVTLSLEIWNNSQPKT